MYTCLVCWLIYVQASCVRSNPQPLLETANRHQSTICSCCRFYSRLLNADCYHSKGIGQRSQIPVLLEVQIRNIECSAIKDPALFKGHSSCWEKHEPGKLKRKWREGKMTKINAGKWHGESPAEPSGSEDRKWPLNNSFCKFADWYFPVVALR